MTLRLAMIGYELHDRGETKLAEVIYKEAGFSSWLRDTAAMWDKHSAKVIPMVWKALNKPGQKAEEMLRGKSKVTQYLSSVPYFIQGMITGFINLLKRMQGDAKHLMLSIRSLYETKMAPAELANVAAILGLIAGSAAAAFVIYKVAKMISSGAANLWRKLTGAAKKKDSQSIQQLIVEASPADRKQLAISIGVAGIGSA